MEGSSLGSIPRETDCDPDRDVFHPTAAWFPNHDGLLEAVANCGKHTFWYDRPAIRAGDLPCPQGCASKQWTNNREET